MSGLNPLINYGLVNTKQLNFNKEFKINFKGNSGFALKNHLQTDEICLNDPKKINKEVVVEIRNSMLNFLQASVTHNHSSAKYKNAYNNFTLVLDKYTNPNSIDVSNLKDTYLEPYSEMFKRAESRINLLNALSSKDKLIAGLAVFCKKSIETEEERHLPSCSLIELLEVN